MAKKFIFIFILALIFTPKSFAQVQPNSISVTPSIAHIDLASQEPFYTLTYQNNTTYNINLNLSVQDFTELEQGYKLSYLSGKDSKNYKYSLSSWISFENPQVELNPREKKSIKVFIDKDRITKGGHYASILAEVSSEQTDRNVNIKQVLSSLLFVRASTGKEVEEGKITSFLPFSQWLEFPDSFEVSFQNSGNVFVTPYGLVQVFDPTGKIVAKGVLNEGSLDVLPESIRGFDIPLSRLTKVLIPGLYKAKIDVHFGKTNQKLTKVVSFFSYGSFDLKIVAVLIFILICVLYYNKRVIRK